MVLETPVDPDSEDPGALVGESDEESSLVPEDMEEELLEGCLVDFSTWSVHYKIKRSSWGKRIDYGKGLF